MVYSRYFQYFAALLLPAIVTLVAIPLNAFLSISNISLLYLVAVVAVGARSGTRPALLSAFASFLSFNFFFTEPRGTFYVLDSADLLTVTLFLLTAVITGHLAAQQREQVKLLRRRERYNEVQHGLMERLAIAIDPEQVKSALESALEQLDTLSFCLVPVSENALVDEDALTVPVPAQLMDRVKKGLESDISEMGQQLFETGDYLATYLADDHSVIAVLFVEADQSLVIERDQAIILAQQANFSLRRMRLAADLEAERIQKEQEVMRSALLASVSHDFRTPLTAMIGATSTLLDLDGTLTQSQKVELLNSVLTESRRLDSYTQKLLDMTRLGRGELSLNRTTIAIEEILNIVVKRIQQHGCVIPLKINMARKLPLLHVHPALIEQAIYNVLENAIKFSPEDGVIHIDCLSEGDKLVIEIEDQGPGIPVQERQKVFEMFHSADRGDHRVAGTGLGLAICKGMIGAHGGSVIALDARQGSGCRIRLALPVRGVGDRHG